MVSYFYNAEYDTELHATPSALLHAQVAILADKYDCASLFKLAKISLGAYILSSVKNETWTGVLSCIYENTTAELPAHQELREMVAGAITCQPYELEKFLNSENTAHLLRSTPDLSTDLILRIQTGEPPQDSMLCKNCGKRVVIDVVKCPLVSPHIETYPYTACRSCETQMPTDSWGEADSGNAKFVQAFWCWACYRFHLIKP